MADYWALSAGDWSNVSNWLTGTSPGEQAGELPGPLDDVYANGRTIVIDVSSIHVNSITTAAKDDIAVDGGEFRPNTGVVIYGNVIPGNTTCITFVSAAPNFFTVIGDISGGTLAGASGINFTSSGVVNISGMVCCGRANSARGITGTSSPTINLTGNVFGGVNGGTFRHGIFTTGGNINVIGIIGTYGGSESYAIQTNNTNHNLSGSFFGTSGTNTALRTANNGKLIMSGVLYAWSLWYDSGNNQPVDIYGDITGDHYFTTSAGGLSIQTARNNVAASGVYNVYGNIYGGKGANFEYGFNNGGTDISVNVYGNVYGGTSFAGFRNWATSGIVTIFGVAEGGFAAAVQQVNAGIVFIKKLRGGPGGPLNINSGRGVGVANSQNGQVYVEEVEYGAQGASPASGPIFMLPKTTNVTVLNQGLPDFVPVTLFRTTNYPGLVPPASSVRLGVVYGNGDFTGTMVVPSPDSVQLGVAVDNTVGRAALSPITVWNFSRNASLSAGSIGERLRNAATTQAVGNVIASFNLSGAS